MATLKRKSIVQPVERVREVYKQNSALFGLITWEEIQSSKRIGSELWIATGSDVHTVNINGKKITI
jgi:hypothetical protein